MSQTKYKPLHQLYEDKRQTRKSVSSEDHSAVTRLAHECCNSTGYSTGKVFHRKSGKFTSKKKRGKVNSIEQDIFSKWVVFY
jgi:hypothetical protein